MKNIQQHLLVAAMLLGFAVAGIKEDIEKAKNEYNDMIYKGYSPKESFYNMSDEMAGWTTASSMGAGIGFAVFALSYIYTVAAIFMDINKSKKEYIDLIELDKRELARLELSQ